MTRIIWTRPALDDLADILAYVQARSRQGAATIATRVEEALASIVTFPRANRLNNETGSYECVLRGVPLLLIYELVSAGPDDVRAEIIAVFHTSRDPDTKPGRRDW